MRHKKFSSIGRDLTSEVNSRHTYKTKRKIKSIAIHCSDSPQGRGDDAHTIDSWHKERWGSGIGYHYVILEDGTIQKGRWVDYMGAGVLHHNRYTIHIVYIGKGDITSSQKKSMKTLTRLLISDNMYKLLPEDIKGHNEYSGHESRGCPLLDMDEIRGGI